MITERVLRKWRKESLIQQKESSLAESNEVFERRYVEELRKIILRLPQELLDQLLLKKQGEKADGNKKKSL